MVTLIVTVEVIKWLSVLDFWKVGRRVGEGARLFLIPDE